MPSTHENANKCCCGCIVLFLKLFLLISWACMADCCVLPSGTMFNGRYGFFLFVLIFGWLCIMAFYALYLLMLADKLIKKFDSRFLVSDTENVHSLLTKRKKERGQDIVVLTEQVWSIKDLLTSSPGLFPSLGTRLRIYYMAKKRTFSCGTTAGNPWTGSQLERRIHFILPARGFCYIIRLSILYAMVLFTISKNQAIGLKEKAAKFSTELIRYWLATVTSGGTGGVQTSRLRS